MARTALLFLFILQIRTYAQGSDTLRYFGVISASGTYNRTNTNRSYLLSNSLKTGAQKKNLKANFNNLWLYGRQDNRLVNNDFTSLFDLNLYALFPGFYYWALANYGSVYSLRINHQVQCGAGVAYNVIDTKKFQLNLSDGLIYDYNDLYLLDGTSDIYETPRNSFRLQVKWWFHEYFNLVATGYYQKSLEYGNDYIIKSEAVLSVKIKKWLSMNARTTYNRMNRTEKENFFITYGASFYLSN